MQLASQWNMLSLEEKIEAMHNDIAALMGIAEELSHKNHVFVDAINLVHANLDGMTKTVRSLEKQIAVPELMF